jgi:hypothetical protein
MLLMMQQGQTKRNSRNTPKKGQNPTNPNNHQTKSQSAPLKKRAETLFLENKVSSRRCRWWVLAPRSPAFLLYYYYRSMIIIACYC